MPRAKTKITSDTLFKQELADRLRHAARNPDINSYQPHEKQLDFHTNTAPGRLFIGGNRSGKTVGGATELVYYALGNHPLKSLLWRPPLRLRVVTVDIEEGIEKIVGPEVRRWMPTIELRGDSWEDAFDKQSRTLHLKNGTFIEFMTYEQKLEKFAGTSRHAVWFDEEPPKDIFTECKLRLLDTEGDWWMTMTPVEGMTWTHEELYEPYNPLIHITEVDMDENPHLSERGKEIALSGLSEEDLEARKHGRYVPTGGLIYDNFDPKIHVINPIPWEELPWEGVIHMDAMDHGYTNATCFLWAYADKSGNLVIYDEYYVEREIIKNHAAAVLAKDKEHNQNREHKIPPIYTVGDPSIRNTQPSNGVSIQIEYMENGITIELANNDVSYGIDRVYKLFEEQKLFITANCVKLIWELRKYHWAVWRTKQDKFDKNKKEEPHKKDDHACDALRYLVASRPEAEDGVTAYQPRNILKTKESVSSDHFVDREVGTPTNNNTYDEHLGVDF